MEPPSFKTFLKAFTASWFTLMSGPLSVPLAIAAAFVPNDIAKAGLALTALVCIVAASYVVWRREREARLAEAAEGKRIAIKDLLGAALTEGGRLLSLRRSLDVASAEKWVNETRNIIRSAFGDGEGELLLNHSPYTFYVDINKTSRQQTWIDGCLRRLAELVARADTVPIKSDFRPPKA